MDTVHERRTLHLALCTLLTNHERCKPQFAGPCLHHGPFLQQSTHQLRQAMQTGMVECLQAFVVHS